MTSFGQPVAAPRELPVTGIFVEDFIDSARPSYNDGDGD
jgi:hypothetical protein